MAFVVVDLHPEYEPGRHPFDDTLSRLDRERAVTQAREKAEEVAKENVRLKVRRARR